MKPIETRQLSLSVISTTNHRKQAPDKASDISRVRNKPRDTTDRRVMCHLHFASSAVTCMERESVVGAQPVRFKFQNVCEESRRHTSDAGPICPVRRDEKRREDQACAATILSSLVVC